MGKNALRMHFNFAHRKLNKPNQYLKKEGTYKMKEKLFSKKELLFITTLSFALGIRQMAMTLIMPFISTYSKSLTYSSPLLAGVALGAFGLSQAIFQIPFGIWSDKVGNKPVMLCGLMQVIIGLIIGFFSKNIYMLIFSRALQGSGAVIAVGYSWISSSVGEKVRTKALSIVGMIIGFAATISFVLGPLLHNILSVKQMFLVCALLILSVWAIILFSLKEDKNKIKKSEKDKEMNIVSVIKELLQNRIFLILNLAAFLNNYIMASVFYGIPQYLDKITGINGMWKVFAPAVIIAIIFMRKTIKFVEKGFGSQLIIISFIITAIGIIFYFNKNSFLFILVGTILFMTGYICLSTVIPSLANDIAENRYRGTTNGLLNSFQYIGSFVGAVITGALWNNQENIVLILLIAFALLMAIFVKIFYKNILLPTKTEEN